MVGPLWGAWLLVGTVEAHHRVERSEAWGIVGVLVLVVGLPLAFASAVLLEM